MTHKLHSQRQKHAVLPIALLGRHALRCGGVRCRPVRALGGRNNRAFQQRRFFPRQRRIFTAAICFAAFSRTGTFIYAKQAPPPVCAQLSMSPPKRRFQAAETKTIPSCSTNEKRGCRSSNVAATGFVLFGLPRKAPAPVVPAFSLFARTLIIACTSMGSAWDQLCPKGFRQISAHSSKCCRSISFHCTSSS